MGRIAAFFATVAVVLAGVATLDWWINPFLDRYDPAPLAAALSQPQPCFLGWDVFGTRAWPTLKLDYFRRRKAHVIVVGTSRAGKIEARPGEHAFANLNLPGTGPETLPALFRRLHSMGHGRLTVYLSVESFWFGGGWRTQTSFTKSYLRNLKYLLSFQTLHATLEELRRAPGALRHPKALRAWAIYRGRGHCVVSRGDTVLAGSGNTWSSDGGLWFNEEVRGAPRPHGQPIAALEHGGYVGKRLDPARVAALERALRIARGYGWRVVGVSLPYSDYWRLKLRNDPATSGVVTAFAREMPGVFARAGFRFLDLTNVRRAGCALHSFSRYDGGHPDAACGMRIRRLLDAAAGAPAA
jgi:hypothetical protein